MAELADFQFTIKYRPGKENIDADSLSRMPVDMATFMNECIEELSDDVIKAGMQTVENQDESSVAWSMGVSVECAAITTDTAIIPLTEEQIAQDQSSDPTISHVIQCKLKDQKPSGPEMKQLNSQMTCLLREWDKLEISETGVLYRKENKKTGPKTAGST